MDRGVCVGCVCGGWGELPSEANTRGSGTVTNVLLNEVEGVFAVGLAASGRSQGGRTGGGVETCNYYCLGQKSGI